MYGITETCVHVTYRPAPGGLRSGGTGSVIGRPLARPASSMCWTQMAPPCPCGVQGELYVGGGGVARGYLGDRR